MEAPVPETSKDTETVTFSKVTSFSSSSSFDRKIIMVTPKRVFCIDCKESEIVRPVQESGEPASAELITPMRVSSANQVVT